MSNELTCIDCGKSFSCKGNRKDDKLSYTCRPRILCDVFNEVVVKEADNYKIDYNEIHQELYQIANEDPLTEPKILMENIPGVPF
jgi:hypothetical protein